MKDNENNNTGNAQDELAAICRDLRIGRAAVEEALATGNPASREFLLGVLRNVRDSRSTGRQVAMTRKARFPYMENIKKFKKDGVEFDEGLSLDDCLSLEFLKKKENIVMVGKSGTGKTMLAICIGMKACENNVQAAYFRVPELARSLGRKSDLRKYGSLLARIDGAGLLILDEFAYTPMTIEESQDIFNIVAGAARKKPIIVTTIRSFSEWKKMIPDEKLAQAFVSRCLDNSHLVNFTGEDHRLINMMEKQKGGSHVGH